MLDDHLLWLINWFKYQCDNEWEHLFGIKIRTLDNPGWAVKISILETELKDKEFKEISLERSENDWIFCKVKKGFFEGHCGTYNLVEVFNIFRVWVEAEQLDVKLVNDLNTIDIVSYISTQKQLKLLKDNLQWIVKWYDSHCDGDWEHTFGVSIETIANPGWSVIIDIKETELEDRIFQEICVDRSKSDWFYCKIEKGTFEGHCGTFNLIELLQSFRTWAEEQGILL